MSEFAEMGTVGKNYINKDGLICVQKHKKDASFVVYYIVYRSLGYFDIVYGSSCE